ncbi:MAG: hypothetical protein HN368_05975, partial [Spirochaetales bacterium]|nr:hypothetical protein [Spirochaetales bacterium]
MRVYRLSIFVLISLLFFSCAGINNSGSSDAPIYYGYGTGPTVTNALNTAKQDILTQVVADLIDEPVRLARKDELRSLFYETTAPNAYFYSDTLDTLTQGKDGSTYVYRIGIRVNLNAVVSTLEANSIYGGMVLPGQTASVELPDKPTPSASAQTPKQETVSTR